MPFPLMTMTPDKGIVAVPGFEGQSLTETRILIMFRAVISEHFNGT